MADTHPDTTGFWYKALLQHPLVSNGMREDEQMRRESLSHLPGLPSIFDDFDAAVSSAHAHNVSPNSEVALEVFEEHLMPEAVKAVLYNAGVTHFLTAGETEEISGAYPGDADEAGAYYHSCECSVTEDSTVNPVHEDNYMQNFQVMRHEAGHALSFALGNVDKVVKPLALAYQKDIRAMSWDESLRFQEKLVLDSGYDLKMGHSVQFFDYEHTLLAARHLIENPSSEDVRQELPHLHAALKDAGYYQNGLPEVYFTLAQHPRIVDAYKADLEDLLSGKDGYYLTPNKVWVSEEDTSDTALVTAIDDFENGVRPPGQWEYEALITDGEGRFVMNVTHYVPEIYAGDGDATLDFPEEPFAENFDSLTDLIAQGFEATGFYQGPFFHDMFPRTANEIKGVLGALDRAYNADPDVAPERAPEPEVRPLAVAKL